MNSRRKILAIALIAALVGGVVGAFAFRDSGQSSAAAPVYSGPATVTPTETVAENGQTVVNPDLPWSNFGTPEQGVPSSNETVVSSVPVRTRTVTRTRYANAPTYYGYTQPRQRSFWQKHRDKLTVAMGTGGGALIGGLIGGKKGAIIGALGGAGGSALYTYKLRKRDRRY